jgi:hypothetical protein
MSGLTHKQIKPGHMFRYTVAACMLLLFFLPAHAQDTIPMTLGGQPVYALVKNGDTILLSTLDEAVIHPRKRSAATRDLRQYRRLIYNVKKVYPYAKLAGEKFTVVNSHLQTLKTGKEQREYIKQVEEELLKQYEEDLKNLTITQGRILIKLIDRETSETSYTVVKELRGSFQAAFWQAIARIFGSNLKTEFDAEGEDKMINEIMIMIEKGQL